MKMVVEAKVYCYDNKITKLVEYRVDGESREVYIQSLALRFQSGELVGEQATTKRKTCIQVQKLDSSSVSNPIIAWYGVISATFIHALGRNASIIRSFAITSPCHSCVSGHELAYRSSSGLVQARHGTNCPVPKLGMETCTVAAEMGLVAVNARTFRSWRRWRTGTTLSHEAFSGPERVFSS